MSNFVPHKHRLRVNGLTIALRINLILSFANLSTSSALRLNIFCTTNLGSNLAEMIRHAKAMLKGLKYQQPC